MRKRAFESSSAGINANLKIPAKPMRGYLPRSSCDESRTRMKRKTKTKSEKKMMMMTKATKATQSERTFI